MESISETDLMDWKAQIDRLGISICPNSAVAVAGAMNLRKNNAIKDNEDVVVILTAHGNKFSNTAIEYHADDSNKFANQLKNIKPIINELERTLEL